MFFLVSTSCFDSLGRSSFSSFFFPSYISELFALLANIGAAHQGGLRSNLTSYRYTYTFTGRERKRETQTQTHVTGDWFICIGGIHTSCFFFLAIFLLYGVDCYLSIYLSQLRIFIVVNNFYCCRGETFFELPHR
ncbi:hypothetical protein F4775DRAFT_533567 [Biscogniauxia sp. FL1348]|nr:hypothetical protein F4775DRAFT_533567 [Biscogniauxia sp. FL1348]